MKIIEVATKILEKINGLVNSIDLNEILNPKERVIIRTTSEIIQNLSTAYKDLIVSHKA
ncbi:hypothetical protein IJQ19_03095 [bacterium]|nr:hypothetical protein [bacterium]